MDEINLSPDGSGLREELYNNWRLYAGVAGVAVLTGVELFRRFGGASSPRPKCKTPRNKVVVKKASARERVDETPSPAKSPKAADSEVVCAEPEPEPPMSTACWLLDEHASRRSDRELRRVQLV